MADTSTPERLLALGAAIRKRRAELGLTMIQAAKRAGISQTSWNDIQQGRRMPYETTMASIETVLEWEPGSCQAVLDGGHPALRRAAIEPLGPEEKTIITDLSDPDQKLTIIVSGRRPLDEEGKQRIIRMAKEAMEQHKQQHHGRDVAGEA